jgi:hypothetical protein
VQNALRSATSAIFQNLERLDFAKKNKKKKSWCQTHTTVVGRPTCGVRVSQRPLPSSLNELPFHHLHTVVRPPTRDGAHVKRTESV